MVLFTNDILIDVLGFVIALVAVGYAYFKWSYQYWKKRNVPYLEPSIPFGSLSNPLINAKYVGDEFGDMYKEIRSRGLKHCGAWLLTAPMYIVTDLELLKHIMTKDFNHFVDRGVYVNEKVDPLSAHLFSITGNKWRNLRAKLSPTFTSGKMKSMFPTLVDCGLVLEKFMEEIVNGDEPIDIKDILGRYTTDVIGSCAFGLDCNSFKEPDSPFRKYGKRIFTVTNLENIRNLFSNNFPNAARALGLRTTPKDVSDFFIKVVEDTVRHREENNVNRKDFLQILIDLKNGKDWQDGGTGVGVTLTMGEVAAQTFLFFIGGYETSSTTMTFTLFELARHPDIQDKVREEINQVLDDTGGRITYDAVNNLKYMGQVIDEALRQYPPIPFMFRECTEEYKVPGEDVILEKGTTVIIPFWGIHHDEEYWKNPEVFDPDRFTEENKQKRHQYAHLPFGEGPRICIGLRFGVMQTKIGLLSILRKFKVTLNDEKTKVPLKFSSKSFVPNVEEGIWLNIEKV